MKMILRGMLAMVILSLVCSTFAFADAAADYKANNCAMCHGANGEGKAAMKTKDFASPDVQGMSDADLAGAIAKGKGMMKGYDGKLSKDQIDGLVKWIRTLKK